MPFIEHNFFVVRFIFNFCLQILNQCKILCFMVLILIYLKKNRFFVLFNEKTNTQKSRDTVPLSRISETESNF